MVVVGACGDSHLGATARVFARGLGMHFLLVMGTHTEKIARAEGGGMEVEGAVPETEEVRIGGKGRIGRRKEESIRILFTKTHFLSFSPSFSLTFSQRDFDPLLFEASLNPLVMKEAVLLALVDARSGVQVRKGGSGAETRGGTQGNLEEGRQAMAEGERGSPIVYSCIYIIFLLINPVSDASIAHNHLTINPTFRTLPSGSSKPSPPPPSPSSSSLPPPSTPSSTTSYPPYSAAFI